MPIRYDPILGKVLTKYSREEELALLRMEMNGKAPINHTHSMEDINGLPLLEFAGEKDIENLF